MNRGEIIPGATIEFISVPRPTSSVGTRGIAIAPLELSWGAEDELIEVFSTDLINGRSLPKIGFTGFDDESFQLNLLLSNCYKSYIYRSNTGGVKASAILLVDDDDSVTVEAVHSGLLGNNITISIIESDLEGLFEVNTFVNSIRQDRQIISNFSQFIKNDYVDITIAGAELPMIAIAGVLLQGGTNGQMLEIDMYPSFFKEAKTVLWQTMVIPTANVTIKNQALQFVNDVRENQKYVQLVIPNFPTDDHGIISINQTVRFGDITASVIDMSYWITGASAGANINESLTARTIQGATQLIDNLDRRDLENNILSGFLSFSVKQNGEVMVIQDINTLTTFTTNRNQEFSKNRIVRTLDEIGTTINSIWENQFMGVVNNDEAGRILFKSNIAGYFYQLQEIGAIQNFNAQEHLRVEQGNTLSSVVASVTVMPIDSMEFLNFTVHVRAV